MYIHRLFATSLVAAACGLGLAVPAAAATFSELADAGHTLAGANDATGVAGLSLIAGALSNEPANGPDWVDLFRVSLAGGDTITASTGPGNIPASLADPVLFVFDAMGHAVAMDDESGGFGQAALSVTGLVGSFYYLAVAFAGMEPLDTNGVSMFDAFGSLAVQSNLPLGSWGGAPLVLDPGIPAAYALSVTAVPEAATWAQLGLGLAALGALARTRRRA
jgi:MYXO-CTERM domain-containing protein